MLKIIGLKKGLLLALFLLSLLGFGQCPTGPILFNTQGAIDAFLIDYPDCTELSEFVRIQGSSITNLQGLQNITSIDNTLEITANPQLQNLQGLNNISYIKNLRIMYNEGLSSLSGLSSLYSVEMLEFQYLNNLTDFEGLNNLNSIRYIAYIRNLNALNSLNGLNNLNNVGTELNISWNQSLTSIDAIENMQPTYFVIQLNQNLSQCAIDTICRRIGIDPLSLSIINNAPGCNSVPEVEAQCQLTITEADFSENLSVFPNPVTSILNIETSNNIFFEKATAYSILGKQILETSKKQINLETLSAGIYFVEVVTNKGTVTKKIVKE